VASVPSVTSYRWLVSTKLHKPCPLFQGNLSFQHNVSTTFWESPLTTLDPSDYSSMWTVHDDYRNFWPNVSYSLNPNDTIVDERD